MPKNMKYSTTKRREC